MYPKEGYCVGVILIGCLGALSLCPLLRMKMASTQIKSEIGIAALAPNGYNNGLPLSGQEIVELFKLLSPHHQFRGVPKYDLLKELCLSEKKYVNTTASLFLLSLHSRKTDNVNQLMNLFQDMVISARDITGILKCQIKLLEYSCENTDQNTCLKCIYNFKSKFHPLYLAVLHHPNAINTILTVLSDSIISDDMFQICLPFFFFVFHATNNPIILSVRSEIWKMVLNSKKWDLILKLLMWFKVSDGIEVEKLILNSSYELTSLYGCDISLLFLVNNLCQKYYINSTTSVKNRYLKENLTKASIGVQSIIAVILCQELCKGCSPNWELIIQLINKIIQNGQVWCEIVWIIIVGLVIGGKHIPMTTEEVNNLVKEFYISSYSKKKIGSYKYPQIIQVICARYPDLGTAVDIITLFTEFCNNENYALAWLRSLPCDKYTLLPIKIVVCSLLIGGTYPIKNEALTVLQKLGGNVRFYFYLLSIETNQYFVFHLLKSLCRCKPDIVDTNLLENTLQELVSEDSNILFLRYLFYNRCRNDDNWLDTSLFYLDKKGDKSGNFCIQKASLLRMIIVQKMISSEKIYTAIIEMLQSYSEIGDIAYSIVLDAICDLWDQNILIKYNAFWGYLLKIAKSTTHLRVKNSFARLLSRVPHKQAGNSSVIAQSAYILWCYAVGSHDCKFAYTALKRYKLSHFNNYFLPKSCTSHMSSDDKACIKGACWLHLLQSGKKEEMGNLFSYLLKKEFKSGDSKITSSFCSSLLKFIKNYHFEDKSKIDLMVMCLRILSGNLKKGLGIKNITDQAKLLMSSGNITICKYTIRLLINQANHDENVCYSIGHFLKNEIKKVYVLEEVFQGLPQLTSAFSNKRFGVFIAKVFEEMFSTGKKKFFLLYDGWRGNQKHIILDKTMHLWSNLSSNDEDFPKVVNCLMKCSKGDVLKHISSVLTKKNGRKLIFLFAEYGKRANTLIFLKLIFRYSNEYHRLRKFGLKKICEVLLHYINVLKKDASSIAYDWLYFVWSPRVNSRHYACDYNFNLAIHSIDILSGNYMLGPSSYALNRFPRGCDQLFTNPVWQMNVLELLKYWRENQKLCQTFRQASNLAIIKINDNVSKDFNQSFWNSAICDCEL